MSPADDFTSLKNVIHFKHRTFDCYRRAPRSTLSNLAKPVIWDLLGGVHCSANLQKKVGRDSSVGMETGYELDSRGSNPV